MSYLLSKRSASVRDTLHPYLKKVIDRSIMIYDFSLLSGYRNESEQNFLFSSGKSQLCFPESLHNKFPSQAFDACPYPVAWHDIKEFERMSRVFFTVADDIGVKLVWGGNWDSFKDYVHFQLA